MASPDCARCGRATILMRCVHCGARACRGCYDTRHALCSTCAEQQGRRVRAAPQPL